MSPHVPNRPRRALSADRFAFLRGHSFPAIYFPFHMLRPGWISLIPARRGSLSDVISLIVVVICPVVAVVSFDQRESRLLSEDDWVCSAPERAPNCSWTDVSTLDKLALTDPLNNPCT